MANLPTLELILKNYKNFNARATRDALIAYWRHSEKGGKMFSTLNISVIYGTRGINGGIFIAFITAGNLK